MGCAMRVLVSCKVTAWLLLSALLTLSTCPLLTAAQDDQQIEFIGVVSAWPVRAQQLAAAVDAARGPTPESPAPVAPVEPAEPLAVPAQVCAQAAVRRAAACAAIVTGGAECADGEECAEGGGEGGEGGAAAAALGSEAAARVGVPLLLVDEAGAAAPASWDVLTMYPHPDVLAQACAALCVSKGWRRAVLLHAGSPRAAALLAPDDEPLALSARRLPPAKDAALLRNLLLVLKKSGATKFIVWCSAECTERVLDAAQRVGLLAERHSYILLTLDLHTRALAAYSHGGANITGMRLFDPESEEVKDALTKWRAAYVARLGGADDEAAASAKRRAAARVVRAPPTALLLAYDAASFATRALQHLALARAAPGSCDTGQGALHADTLLNYIRSEEWSGACGVSVWEAGGWRRRVRLQLVELQRGGWLEPVGSWAPAGGLRWARAARPAPPPPRDQMTNRTFTVLISKKKPYVIERESAERLAGNQRYEGFCIELIERLAELLGFNYTFVEQKDHVYGSFDNKTKQWTGMMRRVMDEPDIHFAITDLTITAEREQGVDFTTPFMNLGISILFRTPKTPEPALFGFLHPFSNGVWLCLGLAYVGTSLFLYVVGRLCPEEWQNPYPCVEEPAALENQFTLANALWFNLGAVLLQGSEIAPIAYGTRAVASVWWLFALVITSSYTANLATLLAKKSSTDLIHNVQELADNEFGIKYGAQEGGSTYTFFENSQSDLYQKMYQNMKNEEMPKNNDAGIDKVVNENYAFLMESTTIEYVIERNCEVTMVGGLLDSKGYGIAMKKNSTYRHAMNLALLNLQEAGVLREMKHKWWKEMHGGGACNALEDRENAKLSMRNFLGLFLVLVVGCALGVLISCGDLCLAAARRPREPALGFLHNYWSELCFVFRFEQSEKPLHGSLTPTPTPPNTDSGTLRSTNAEQREDEAEAEAEAARARSESRQSRRRRRSSIHAASVRLARHAKRHSGTPNSLHPSARRLS